MLKTMTRPNGITTEILIITPDLAAAMLSKNTKNRKSSPMTVKAYARDMKAGNWQLNGDAIRFDINGNLLDGQHRLAACVAAETHFQSIVIYGLPAETQNTMDQGRVRSSSDILGINGAGSTMLRAATLRLLYVIKMDVGIASAKPTSSEILALHIKHPHLGRSFALGNRGTIGVRPAMLSAIHYIGSNILKQPERADAYARVFISGAPDYDGCPALLIRERAIQGRLRQQPLAGQLMFDLMVHAWNHFRHSQPLRTLKAPKEVKFDDLDLRKL